MKIDNDKFNEWLEKENDIAYRVGYIEKYPEERTINQDELIGLMTIYLLDNGYNISKVDGDYFSHNFEGEIGENTDLYTALKQAIESIKE